MFAKYLTLTIATLSAVTAAPIARRDGCTPGLFNCIDGTSYAQCVSGGTWSVTMPVAPGTTCNIGISENPFAPGGGSSSSPAPAPAPEPAPAPARTTTPPASQPTSAPKNDPPPPPSTGDGSTTIPSGSNTGNGAFPDISSWLSWDDMKSRYINVMGTSCSASGWGPNNSPEETQEVLSAIESFHGSVDPRFLLAIMIQESSGCVRVITTNNGVRNPGLLQDSNGAHTCNDAGNVQNPCPTDEINGMIQDGVSGGSNNLQSALGTAIQNNFGNSYAYAVAARIYNSGSFDPSNLNNPLGSTADYVQSVMDRLVGRKL